MSQVQIETATVIVATTIGTSGNATVIVASQYMTGSPKTFSVAVVSGDDASAVALAIRNALVYDSAVSAEFVVSGATDKVILTSHVAKANDASLNISVANDTCTGITAAPTSANTQAGIGITNGYATLADLRSAPALNFESTYTTDDQILSDIITSVSREIDRQCSRFFYKSVSSEVKYFTAQHGTRLFCGDVVSVTSLITDTQGGDRTYPYTWATTDYDLWPYDAASYSEPEPYRFIDKTPRGMYQFPFRVAKGVKLDAVYGWPAVPVMISKACLLWSERIYKRLSTPLGSATMSQLGTVSLKVPAPDPDIEAMINNYRLVAV